MLCAWPGLPLEQRRVIWLLIAFEAVDDADAGFFHEVDAALRVLLRRRRTSVWPSGGANFWLWAGFKNRPWSLKAATVPR
jgi:hypothetical protein